MWVERLKTEQPNIEQFFDVGTVQGHVLDVLGDHQLTHDGTLLELLHLSRTSRQAVTSICTEILSSTRNISMTETDKTAPVWNTSKAGASAKPSSAAHIPTRDPWLQYLSMGGKVGEYEVEGRHTVPAFTAPAGAGPARTTRHRPPRPSHGQQNPVVATGPVTSTSG